MTTTESSTSEMLDRFARFYDADYRHYDDDLAAIAQLAEEQTQTPGGTLLELGCGTGRVLVPLATLGFSITGVDLSPALLAAARQKVRDSQTANRVTLVQADLRSFALPQRDFCLAICTSNTLMHLTTPADQLAALRNAHRHLRSGGLLFLDLFNPDIARLLEINAVSELADQWRDETNGADVLKWSVRTLDLAEQQQETTFIYEEVFADGRAQRTVCPFTLRFLWRNEAELMLEKAGFDEIEVWGDFDGSDYGSWSDHLILLAHKP